MANEDQHKLLTPSMWNTRLSPEDVATNFEKLGDEVTRRARKNTRCQLDVPYGPSEKTKYDVYGTDLPDDAPILIFIHGGYWQILSKDINAFAVENLVSAGIKVIVVGYDLCPKVQVREIVGQIKKAVHQILDDAAKRGSRGVWVCGHSVGSHLTASLLETEWLENEPNLKLIKGLVMLCGFYFLEPLVTSVYNEPLKLDINEAKRLSTLNVPLKAPVPNLKAVVVVGEADSPAFIKQSRQVLEKLSSSLDEVEYVFLRDNIDHYNILENLADKNYSITKKIIKYIKESTA